LESISTGKGKRALKYLIIIVVILCVIANSTYAIEHSAISNEFILDTRDAPRISMEHSALSNVFTLDTRNHIYDINQDGVVNILDMVLLAKNFGKVGNNVVGDVNGDGKVDALDLDMLSKHFGEKNQ
jgi:hypothetical protein